MDIEELKKLFTTLLFDSASFPVLPCTNTKKAMEQSPEFNKNLGKAHLDIFNLIVEMLEDEFKGTGMQSSFSTWILINQVAMNMVTLAKVLAQSQAMFLVDVVHKDIVLVKNDALEDEYTPLNKEYNIHPFFEKLYFKLQDQINDGLKKLGLLPMQQIEKQKLTIVKKLKQKVEEIDREFSVKAEKEVLTTRKKDARVRTEKAVKKDSTARKSEKTHVSI